MTINETEFFPCGIFDYTLDFDSKSSESFIFSASNCVSNKLQFYQNVIYLAIMLVIFVVVLVFFVYYLIIQKAGRVPTISVSMALVSILAVAMMHLVHLFGVRGPLRMFPYALSITTGFLQTTYLLKEWYNVIITTHIGTNRPLQRKIYLSFIFLNLFVQLTAWPLLLIAGAMDKKNPIVGNVLVVITFFCFGLMAFVIDILILYASSKLRMILRGVGGEFANEETKRRVNRAIKRIKVFSLVQTSIGLSGGMGGIGLGVWGVVCSANGRGLDYFYYFGTFSYSPTILVTSLMIVYAALTFKKKDTSTSSDCERSQQSSKANQISFEPRKKMSVASAASAATTVTTKTTTAMLHSSLTISDLSNSSENNNTTSNKNNVVEEKEEEEEEEEERGQDVSPLAVVVLPTVKDPLDDFLNRRQLKD